MIIPKPKLETNMKNTKSYKISPVARCAAWGAQIAIAAFIAVTGSNAFAAAFTPGDLVVERLGDGTETLSVLGNTIFFLEYSTTGTLVQTVTIPDGSAAYPGSPAMAEAGTGATTGCITLSPDGQTLSFPGYAVTTNPNPASIVAQLSSTIPRAIGTMTGSGIGSYAQITSTIAYSASNIRGAVADGENNFWASGTASTTSVNAGVYYFGTASSAADINSGVLVGAVGLESGTLRGINIFNGQLWVTTSATTSGIYAFPGLPTTYSANPPIIVTFANNDSCYNFQVSPDGMTIFDADDGGFATNYAGIGKWTGSGTSWTKSYVLLGGSSTPTNLGCFGLTVKNWQTGGANGAILFATTVATSANKLITVTDSGPSAAPTTLATAASKEFFRGVEFVPTNASGTLAPDCTGIFLGSPNFVSAGTVNAGSTVTVAATALGTPVLNYTFSGPNSLSQGPGTADNVTIGPVYAANAGSYSCTVTNTGTNTPGSCNESAVSLTVIDPAFLVQPEDVSGLTCGVAVFQAQVAGTGMSYQWYYSDTTGNTIAVVPNGNLGHGTIVSGASGSLGGVGTVIPTLTLSNLNIADFTPQQVNGFPIATNFVVVVSGSGPNSPATSQVVELYSDYNSYTVFNSGGAGNPGDVIAFWDFNTGNSTVFPNDANPQPYFGNGTAQLASTLQSPFITTVVDANDGFATSFPDGQNNCSGSCNWAWGTTAGPATNATVSFMSNKLWGMQFLASTVGANNIGLTYDSRVSATASDYERVQFTTNSGTTWIDYPSSSSMNGHGTIFQSYTNSFYGFSNVANNPDFGIRIVTELQNTATYGAGGGTGETSAGATITPGTVITNYVGTANSYGVTGTFTVDILALYGDELGCSATYTQPSITGVANQSGLDAGTFTVNFTVSGGAGAPYSLSAVSLNPTKVSPTFGITQPTTGNFQSVLTPNGIPDPTDAAPLLYTAKDSAGNAVATWFDLLLSTTNPAPSITGLVNTNMLPNKTLAVPFTVGTAGNVGTTIAQLTNFTVASDNNTLVPVANLAITGKGTASPTITITPAIEQVGMGQIAVSLDNDDPSLPKTTTVTFSLMVRPNTNVVFADYFNYDAGQGTAGIDQITGSYWNHLSGTTGLGGDAPSGVGADGGGYVTVNSSTLTLNAQAPLIGTAGQNSFFYSNSTANVLYSSFTVQNLPAGEGGALPVGGPGAYFVNYNDNTGITGNTECGVWAVTNGAATGNYRLGIRNFPDGNGTESFANVAVYPQDLIPGNWYTVVTSYVVSNGQSTLWINPTNGPSSPSVSDTVTAGSVAANLYNIGCIELRESSSEATSENAGINLVSHMKVGLTFDSVYPTLQETRTGMQIAAGGNTILNWSDPTLDIQWATNIAGPWTAVTVNSVNQPPYTNNTATNAVYWRLIQYTNQNKD
jgi:hypothetical protein